MPLSFPQEFLNWICTRSLSQRRCSIRFLDDWWTRFIGSQLLYAQRDNWITPWGNWLLCYGMHQGKLSNLPGAWKPPLNWDQISCYWWKVWCLCFVTGNDSFPHYPSLFIVSLWTMRGNEEGSGSSVIWWSNKMYWHRKPAGRDFQTFWSIMRWNYSSLCWVLVNYIPAFPKHLWIFQSN